MKRTIESVPDLLRLTDALKYMAMPFTVSVEQGRRRNNDQNALLWAICSDIAAQVNMPLINGQLVKSNAEEWKQFLSALHDNERKIAVGENGELIVLAQSTSRMTKAQFSSLVEFMLEFCARRGVKLSQPVPPEYEQWAAR